MREREEGRGVERERGGEREKKREREREGGGGEREMKLLGGEKFRQSGERFTMYNMIKSTKLRWNEGRSTGKSRNYITTLS